MALPDLWGGDGRYRLFASTCATPGQRRNNGAWNALKKERDRRNKDQSAGDGRQGRRKLPIAELVSARAVSNEQAHAPREA
jgi:hypothetical protein